MARDRALLALAFAMVAAPGAAAEAPQASIPRTISVSVTGEVSAIPDIAQISAGVTSDAATAREALDRTGEAMAKVISAIKETGVTPADIQTSAINVRPRYASGKPGEAATVKGFTADNQVRFTYRKIEGLGAAIDKVVAAGANQIHGISFSIANQENLLDQARRKAMETAFKRGQLYAEAAKAVLGEVLVVDENVSGRPQPIMTRARAEYMSTPIEQGTQMISVSISVTFALK